MPAAGDSPLLEVAIEAKSRGRIEIIDGLRFTLARGSVACLLGPSGCGKTTALRIVLGLDTDFTGHIEPPATRLRLGVVFQDPRLLPWRTVAQNVTLAAPALGRPALDALLDELGLAAWRDHRPNQLSLGMARRVALARALAVDPDFVVLDEAFVSLDEGAAATLRGVVFGALARRHATTLMVTHSIDEALCFSDTIHILAPRPTSVVETLALETPRGARDAVWIERERRRIAAGKAAFLRQDA